MGYRFFCLRLYQSALLSLIVLLIGCEKVPTFQELTGQQQAASSSTPSNSPPTIATQPTTRSTIDSSDAAPVDAAKVLSELQNKPSTTISDADLQLLASLNTDLGQVKSLDLTHGMITDNGLGHLAKLTELIELNLSLTEIDGHGLAALRDCRNLKKLKFSGGLRMTAQGWETLGTLTQLEILDISETPNISDNDVLKLTALENLYELNLSKTRVTDQIFASLSAMQSLGVLRIEHDDLIDGHGLQMYSRAKPALRELHARGTQIGRAGLRHIKGMSRLEFLDISNSLLNDTQFAELKGANNLLHLKMGGNFVTNVGIQTILSLANLKTLDLEGMTTIGDPALAVLTKKRGLETLNLVKTPCTPRAIEAFRKLHKNCEVLASE